MGAIESWTPEQKREFMHNFLEYVEIYPEALDNGRLVKRIRFKIPVSVDGGQTYSRTIDLDDDTPPDEGSQGGGGPLPPIGPYDNGDFPIGDILPSDGVDLQTANVLPNQDTGFLVTESSLVSVRLHRGSLRKVRVWVSKGFTVTVPVV